MRAIRLVIVAAAATWCLSISLCVSGCRDSPGSAAGSPPEGRGRSGPIAVGAVWPWASRRNLLYGQGLDMAVDEINFAGGVLGRRLTIVREDDDDSIERGRLVAQRLAEHRELVAVIGHLQSYVTTSTAAIYDGAGVLMIAPTATE